MLDEELMFHVKQYNKMRRNWGSFEINKEYENILKKRYNKISRIKKRLVYMMNRRQFLWFITFTFDDDLIKRCDRTKRDLIKDSLKQKDFLYILNVDYGSKTEREHYHCILGTNQKFDLDFYLKSVYPCFVYAEMVRTTDSDFARLSKYINKLSNHCIKDSTKNKKIYFNFKLPTYKLDSYSQWKRNIYELALLDKANVTGKR